MSDALPPRYRDPVRIAAGGMGEVYRAHDDDLGRTVAVKILARRFAEDDVFRRRFRREAVSAARIDHPSVARVYDVGEHDGRPYLVMEYVPGGNLDQRMSRGRPTRAQALAWVGQAAAALDAAHAVGVVHRDVKPANLLLDESERVKVADFGIARLLEDTGNALTATGTVLGSSGYVSPEQAQSRPATVASDVYSLAAVAFELLVGERPYAGRSGVAEMAAHVYEPVPTASERYQLITAKLKSIALEGLPPRLDAVLARGLAKDPDDRYPRAGDLAAALVAATAGDEASATAVYPSQRQAAEPDGDPPGKRRLPVLAGAAVVVALLGGAAAAALIASGGDDDPTASTPAVQTVARTVTQVQPAAPPRTVVQTVTQKIPTASAPAPAPTPAPTPAPAAATIDDAVALTDRSTAALSAGDPATGLRLADQALAVLAGTGVAYEGNASYNRGRALIDLDRCDEAAGALEDSVRIGGSSSQMAIRQADLAEARECADGSDRSGDD